MYILNNGFVDEKFFERKEKRKKKTIKQSNNQNTNYQLTHQSCSDTMNTPTSQRSNSESTPQPSSKLDFDFFLRQLRSKRADPVLRYIRSFINNFTQKDWNVEEQVKLIGDFKEFIFGKLGQYEPFSLMSSVEFENAKIGVEKLVMTKLYDHVYSPAIPSKYLDPSHREDLELDESLEFNYKKYHYLTAKDLDVDEKLVDSGSQFIQLAAEELNKVSNYKAPRAKTVCLLNACKILFQLIKKSDQNQNADEFLPLLIYTVLKGKVHSLYSNLNYIERFGFVQSSETLYYLVSLNAAAEFIRSLDQSRAAGTD